MCSERFFARHFKQNLHLQDDLDNHLVAAISDAFDEHRSLKACFNVAGSEIPILGK